jgi:hypothetical protein
MSRLRCNVRGRETGKLTRLYPSLLPLIHSKLLQLLLVAVGKFRKVDIAEAAAHVHFCEVAWVGEFKE